MKKKIIYSVVSILLLFGLGFSSLFAQETSTVFEMLDHIESRLNKNDAARKNDVLRAPNIRRDIYLYKEISVDVIFTDIMMPSQDGTGIIRIFKKKFPLSKIIAISGGGRVSADQCLLWAKTLGATKTFSKPIDRNETSRD